MAQIFCTASFFGARRGRFVTCARAYTSSRYFIAPSKRRALHNVLQFRYALDRALPAPRTITNIDPCSLIVQRFRTGFSQRVYYYMWLARDEDGVSFCCLTDGCNSLQRSFFDHRQNGETALRYIQGSISGLFVGPGP